MDDPSPVTPFEIINNNIDDTAFFQNLITTDRTLENNNNLFPD